MKYILILVALMVLIAPKTVTAAPKHAASNVALICPVSGDTIPSIKAAVGHSVYKGKTYYFCCSDCKPKFDADPEKYVKAIKSKTASQ